MATTLDFIEYVCEQVREAGDIRFKKMFGEYMVYYRDKPALLVCDNTVFVKMLPVLAQSMSTAEKGIPYSGAKEHYILDIDDAEKSVEILKEIELYLSVPKKRKTKVSCCICRSLSQWSTSKPI